MRKSTLLVTLLWSWGAFLGQRRSPIRPPVSPIRKPNRKKIPPSWLRFVRKQKYSGRRSKVEMPRQSRRCGPKTVNTSIQAVNALLDARRSRRATQTSLPPIPARR